MLTQWLGFWAFITWAPGLTPDQGIKIPQAIWHGQEKKESLGLGWKEAGATWHPSTIAGKQVSTQINKSIAHHPALQ